MPKLPTFTQDLVEELNMLARFDLVDSQHGIKIHSTADVVLVASAQRLFAKGLISQIDGGYLTRLGRDAAEHAQALLAVLTSGVTLGVGQEAH